MLSPLTPSLSSRATPSMGCCAVGGEREKEGEKGKAEKEGREGEKEREGKEREKGAKGVRECCGHSPPGLTGCDRTAFLSQDGICKVGN